MCKGRLWKSGIVALVLFCSCARGATPVQVPAKSRTQGPVPVSVYRVTAAGGLRVRSQPSVDGDVVGLLEQGVEIELEESENTIEATINDRKGHWRRYKEGWIFDGYLERGTLVYYSKRARGIPIYPTPAIGTPVRVLDAGRPIAISSVRSPGTVTEAPGWIHGTFSDRPCSPESTSSGWIYTGDLRPAAPRQPFCSHTVKRNCIDPALKRFIMAGTVNDRQECVYQSALTLYPEGEVFSCPGRIGSWNLKADGSIAVALHKRVYRSTMSPVERGIVITRPALILIRKLNVNSLRFPAEAPTAWPQWRENIRKSYFGGQDTSFLPVTPDNAPFAVYAYEC